MTSFQNGEEDLQPTLSFSLVCYPSGITPPCQLGASSTSYLQETFSVSWPSTLMTLRTIMHNICKNLFHCNISSKNSSMNSSTSQQTQPLHNSKKKELPPSSLPVKFPYSFSQLSLKTHIYEPSATPSII